MSVELNQQLQRAQAQFRNQDVQDETTRRHLLDEISDLLREMGAATPATQNDARAVQEAALAHAAELPSEVLACFERVLHFLSKPPPH